jgi:hypothetical protein
VVRPGPPRPSQTRIVLLSCHRGETGLEPAFCRLLSNTGQMSWPNVTYHNAWGFSCPVTPKGVAERTRSVEGMRPGLGWVPCGADPLEPLRTRRSICGNGWERALS